MSFEVCFLPYGPMLTITKKNRKNQNVKFWITKLVQRYSDKVAYLFTKLGINLLDTFWKNGFYEWTDDGRPREDNSYALQEHKADQLYIKNQKYKILKQQTKMILRNGGKVPLDQIWHHGHK